MAVVCHSQWGLCYVDQWSRGGVRNRTQASSVPQSLGRDSGYPGHGCGGRQRGQMTSINRRKKEHCVSCAFGWWVLAVKVAVLLHKSSWQPLFSEVYQAVNSKPHSVKATVKPKPRHELMQANRRCPSRGEQHSRQRAQTGRVSIYSMKQKACCSLFVFMLCYYYQLISSSLN